MPDTTVTPSVVSLSLGSCALFSTNTRKSVTSDSLADSVHIRPGANHFDLFRDNIRSSARLHRHAWLFDCKKLHSLEAAWLDLS